MRDVSVRQRADEIYPCRLQRVSNQITPALTLPLLFILMSCKVHIFTS